MRSKSARRHRILSLERVDVQPQWMWLAIAGVAGAVLLALFGLPPVDLHGPLHRFGIMDPLCGGTRAMYLTMRGQMRDGIRYNPAAPMLLAVAVVVLARAALGRTTGRWVTVRLPPRFWVLSSVVAVAALELHQQLHAELLMEHWNS